jgi:hypothetical protein
VESKVSTCSSRHAPEEQSQADGTALQKSLDNIILHQSLGTPIITMVSSIEAYTLNPWNKTNSCNNTCPDAPHQPNNPGSKPVTSNGDKAPCTSAGDKHNTTTPESRSMPSLVQRQKNQCRVVTNNTVKCAKLDMGMFWLSNPKMKMNEIFPCGLHEKVCIQFCCRGRECKRDPDIVCPFFHPCSSEDLKLETIELIRDQILAKKVGWLTKYHFLKLLALKPKYKALLAGKDGPTSKTGNHTPDTNAGQNSPNPPQIAKDPTAEKTQQSKERSRMGTLKG